MKYLSEKLSIGILIDLDTKMLEKFKNASNKTLAKACCVISNEKYIKYDITKREDKQEFMMLLDYFATHKDFIEKNLNVNRIFSFPKEKNSNIIALEEKQHKLNILLLMIVNSIHTGVNTFLHLYDEKSCSCSW